MSKLRKLLVHPDLFFRDAIVNRRIKAALGRGGSATAIAPQTLELPFVRALLSCVRSNTSAFLTYDHSGQEWLNCFREDLPVLMQAALDLASAKKRHLLVLNKRQPTTLHRGNFTTTMHQLLEAETFELALEAPLPEIVGRVAVWETRANDEAYCRAINVYAKKLPRSRLDDVIDPTTRVADLSALYECPIDSVCSFDIDVVYTWVDHTDEAWRAALAEHRNLDEVAWERFRSNDELKYSLRSVHQFCPWVRRIFVLTNCRPPEWLKPHPRITWVDHADVFPSPEACLPTFNSHAIEANLMRIDGLSEHFIYMNDDVFIGVPCPKDTFFLSNGQSISYLERYGMIHGAVDDERPDHMNAAINGQRLIEDAFGVSPTQLHAHTPHALRKSVLFEMEQVFADAFERVRRSRFRSTDDVSVVSFLYHHYAYQKREALRVPASDVALIRPENAAQAFVQLLTGRVRRFCCINDAGDEENPKFVARSREVLETMYPEEAPWEK